MADGERSLLSKLTDKNNILYAAVDAGAGFGFMVIGFIVNQIYFLLIGLLVGIAFSFVEVYSHSKFKKEKFWNFFALGLVIGFAIALVSYYLLFSSSFFS